MLAQEIKFRIISAGGISLSSSSVTLSSNSITGNSGSGIFLNSSDGCTINGNTAFGNSGLGISVTSSSGNQITNNIVGTNTLGGISITSSTGNITGNTVTNNLAFGISLGSVSGITLSQNEISGNSSNGLVINGNANQILENAIYNNNASGVLVASGNHNSILKNSIYGNTTLGIELAAGTNDSQLYPTLNTLYTWQDESALPEIKGGSSIQGVVNGTPGQNYKIQFFANSGLSNREGKRFLGEILTTSDISGKAEFLANLKDAVLTTGEVVSATATRLDLDSLPLSTSEYSASIERATDEGNHYIVNTTLAGIPLHWKDGEGDYEIFGSVTTGGVQPPAGFAASVENGFDTWTGLEQLTYTKRAQSIANSGKWGGNADGINNVVWFPSSTMWQDSTEAPTNVIAVTRVRYNALNG
ncbi:MAG: right-handed parallel beta-helix repeat-containing protein, partial [Ignavibacteriaceae bacterium]|nr:right-handed parallel beta-helix repeat-containing protein [Ignavibacteriaceae bacterium]